MGQGTEAGKGAVGGALAGAGAGAMFGPVGMGIGAGAGALLGGIGGWMGGDQKDEYQKRLEAYYASLGNREAPQAGPAAQGAYSGFRQNQSDLIGRLEALSSGQGPSLAAQQFRQATDQNMRGQQAMANSGRGGAMASFNAANNMGMLGAQAAQGSAAARTQEEQMALQQLGLTVYGARNADEQMNQFNAQQQNQMAIQNLDARLRAMGMNDQARLSILQQMGGQANQPTFGDQLMAGGAGMFAQGATMGKKPSGPTAWANGQGSLYGMGGPKPTNSPGASPSAPSMPPGVGSGNYNFYG